MTRSIQILEPEEIESLKLAYPEGLYTFTGLIAAGDKLAGAAKLAHNLPPPASFKVKFMQNSHGSKIL